MDSWPRSHSRYLWLTVVGVCLALAAIGRLFGTVPRPVLDGLFPHAVRWWDLPAVVHVPVLILGGGLALLCGRRLLTGVRPPRSKPGRFLTGALLLLGCYLCLVQFGEMNRVISRITDFGTIHRGSAALFAGADPYAATDNGYFYPPLLAFLFGPLALLPPAGASLLFFTLKFVLLVWTLAACDRLVGGRRFADGRRVLFLLGLVFVASRFWVADMRYGNTNVLIMFLVVASILWDREDRPRAAGLALALAFSIKIVPALLCLHFLITGRRRTLAWFAAAVAALNLLPWLFLQGHWWSTWGAYFDAGVAGKLGQRLAQPDNQSLWGVISRMFPDGSMTGLHRTWSAAAALLCLFACLVSLAVRRRDDDSRLAAAALYPLLGLLVSPGSWVVHYTAVLLPMVVLWRLALSGAWSGRVAWPLFFVANLAFTMSGWARFSVNASINQSWFVAAAVLLMAGLGAWSLRPDPAA